MFLVNVVVPVLWHQVPVSSSPERWVPLWSPHEAEFKPTPDEESREPVLPERPKGELP